MKKVFVCGYYGFKNMGDEALLKSISKIFDEVSDEIEIEALSYNVKYTENTQGIKGFSRKSLLKLIVKIFNSDYIVFGGGSLLQDVTSSKSLIYYLGIIFLGRIFNKPVALIGNGFGPVKKPANKFLVVYILNKVNFISARDRESFKWLKEIGVKKEIIISSDVTFLLSDWKESKEIDFFKKNNLLEKEKLIGISIRPWENEKYYILEIAKFADYLVEKEYRVIFIPMKYPSDIEISNKIIEKMKNNEYSYLLGDEYNPNEIIKAISNFHILVGMRLHSLIFSTIAGVPSIAIEYDPKIKSFAKEAGIANVGNVDNIKNEDLIVLFNEVESKYIERINILNERREDLIERAEFNKAIISEMLNKF